MRKVFLLAVLLSISCISQNKQILYNFTSVPQSLLTNPGLDVKFKWYFGVPLVSGISANVGSSGFSAYDLFADDGIDFNTKLRNVVNSTSRNDKASINEQLEVFSGGFKLGGWQGNSYVTFGMYQELDIFAYVPKDPIILGIYGNKDYLGKRFNLGDLSGKAEMLTVLHLGYHKVVNNKLILGARGKIYSGIFNVNSTNNSGYIFTVPNTTNTIYTQEMYSNITVNTSGIAKYKDENYNGDVAKDLRKKAFLGGDLGLGFDVGMTYYPQKNIQFTASIADVGFINHGKDVENYTLKGTYKFEGVNPDFINGSTPEDTYQKFKDAIPLDTLHTKYTTWRPIKLNTSIQYSFGEERDTNTECNCISGAEARTYKNAIGAQLFIMSTPRIPFVAFTTYYRRPVFKGLDLKTTYTIDSYSYKNIGLGLSAHAGIFNFYMLADNLLEYKDITKANSLSFQFGFNIIMKDSKVPY